MSSRRIGVGTPNGASSESEDAHHLFDELLRRSSRASIYDLNRALTAVARDFPAVAISLFNRMVTGRYRRVARLDLAFATFGRVIRAGWRVKAITFNPTPDVFSYAILLKGLCDDNRTQLTLDLLCIMMADDHTAGGCPPNVVIGHWLFSIDNKCGHHQ
uniref:Pentatricopeptide repeat-containing protein n=1 Tax=Leersia perrieri TaxID=77586 RepID=A0A0D9X3K8_9ORYZ